MLVAAAGGVAFADNGPAPGEAAVAEAEAEPNAAGDRAAEENEERIEQRRRTVAAMLWIVVGVAIVGVTLLFCVLFWGAHTRRVVRTPLPGQTRDEPFWYLKKKVGGTSSENDDAPQPSDDERRRDE